MILRGAFSFMIIKDKNYTDIIWSYASNGQEYNRFAIEFWTFFDYDTDLFYDTFEIRDECNDELINPLTDDYQIRNRPDETEYPIIISYCACNRILTWVSLNDLIIGN